MKFHLLTLVMMLAFGSLAQTKNDTVYVDASKVNVQKLMEGTQRYLVYFKMGPDSPRSRPQFWTRTISFIDYNGSAAVEVTQEWEDRDTVVHIVRSVCDRKTFAPLYQKSWWRQGPSSEFDLVQKKAQWGGQPLSDADTARLRKYSWLAFQEALKQYTLNWHLDLEVFTILPYKEGTTFLIPFYDPGSAAPRKVAYTVTGSARLNGYNGQEIDCWLLSHESRGLKDIFWISKKTQEVLKLEGEIGKNKWRYKIRMGFSS